MKNNKGVFEDIVREMLFIPENIVKKYWYHPECRFAHEGKKLGLNKKEGK